MPSSKIVAAHGALRVRRTGDNGNCELVYLSYLPTTWGLPRAVEANVIEQFYSVEDGLHRLCEMSKN